MAKKESKPKPQKGKPTLTYIGNFKAIATPYGLFVKDNPKEVSQEVAEKLKKSNPAEFI